MDFRKSSNNELVKFLAHHAANRDAWQEFVNRFHNHICSVIYSTCKSLGFTQGVAEVEDLAQDVYLKFLKNDCQALKAFRGENEGAIFTHLKVTSIRVVLNEYRKWSALKRPPLEKKLKVNEAFWQIPSERSVDLIEIQPTNEWKNGKSRIEIVLEIEDCLERVMRGNKNSERNKMIFRLYFFQGYSAEDLASFEEIGLSRQRIFGVTSGIKKSLKKCLEN